MRIAYRVDNVPSVGATAFMPAPAMTGSAATAGVERRYLAQFTPAPPPMLAGQQPGGAVATTVQGSNAQPPPGTPLAFARQTAVARSMKYWTTPYQMGASDGDLNMKLLSDNVLPVPANNPGRVALPVMQTPPWATVISTAWPRPYISWPTWGASRQQ